jgi:hypothetical protein
MQLFPRWIKCQHAKRWIAHLNFSRSETMKICSKEMAAIVFGAGAPSGFGGGGSSGGGFGSGPSAVSRAGPNASSTGAAAAGTIVGNSINGDGSFQNAVATVAGASVGWGVEAGSLLATRNPVLSVSLGTLSGTATANHVNSLDASAGPPTNVDAMGFVQGPEPEGTRGDGFNSSGGGSAAGSAARGGMGFGGTGSGVG